jgi:transcription elongation factor GreA
MSIPMTQNGKIQLETELNTLVEKERPDIIKAIASARELGDLKENAEYHSAKERQSFIEGRIEQIQSSLSDAQVIITKNLPNNGRVIFGSTAQIKDNDTGEKRSVLIVGEDEASENTTKISYKSPIARAIIGKNVGDVVSVTTPAHSHTFSILKVEYI